MSRNLPLLALMLSLSIPQFSESRDDLFGSSRPVLGGVSIHPVNLAGRGVGGTSSSHGPHHYQPDNWIGTRRWRQTGNDVYNSSGSRQRVTVGFHSRRSERFYFTIQNDHREHDHLTVTAPRRDRDYRLSYYQVSSSTVNITSSITTYGYRSESLSSGETRDYRVRVKPLRRFARRGKLRGVYVKTVSDDASHARDCVKAEFKRY